MGHRIGNECPIFVNLSCDSEAYMAYTPNEVKQREGMRAKALSEMRNTISLWYWVSRIPVPRGEPGFVQTGDGRLCRLFVLAILGAVLMFTPKMAAAKRKGLADRGQMAQGLRRQF